jgi:hypothetical protein
MSDARRGAALVMVVVRSGHGACCTQGQGRRNKEMSMDHMVSGMPLFVPLKSAQALLWFHRVDLSRGADDV